MEILTLSYEELCFAILIESHTAVCYSLFEFVVSAVKFSEPEKWKEVVCSCYTPAVKQHVRQRLENNLPLEDFYVVCKLFRCRINDVANFYGGCLLDPQDKERLSLQVQGVETARHWAFHGGQYVSAEEVRSSIALLLTILRMCILLDNSRTAGRSLATVSATLSRLYTFTETLIFGSAKNTYVFPQSTIERTLLYSSLRELQKNFEIYFQQEGEICKPQDPCSATKISSSGEAAAATVEKADDFPRLMRQIQKGLKKKQKRNVLQKQVEIENRITDHLLTCKKVLAARNALAHNGKRALSDIRDIMYDIRDLLLVFGLEDKGTKSALKRLMQVYSGNGNSTSCILMQCRDDSVNFKQGWTRLLRPKGRHFVGRRKEVSLIKSVFVRNASQAKQALLIFGPAGMGKSFLAGEIAHDLTKTFRTQVWLNCSSYHDIQQDISHSPLFSCGKTSFLNPNSTNQQREKIPNNAVEGMCLMVLDDVRSSTMHVTTKLVEEAGHSVIITTRSTFVKQSLQLIMQKLTVVNLNPFSLAESWALVEKKIDVSEIGAPKLALMKRALCNVLGNLPLCVSIYASLKAFIAKRLSQGYDRSPMRTWREIEYCFGDQLHVRGLTGIVQLAIDHIRDNPFVLLLLMKICSLNTPSIPWEILREGDWRRLWVSMHQTGLAWLDYLVTNLLGVTDWLFSKGGQRTLETCRDTLEDLGLIYLDSDSVSIHHLTFKSLQNMLQKRYFFLDIIVTNALPGMKYVKTERLTTLTKRLLRSLTAELFFHSISRLLNLVLESLINSLEDQSAATLLYVVRFLPRVVEEDTLPVLKELLTTKQLEVLSCHMTAYIQLLNYSTQFTLRKGTDTKTDNASKHFKGLPPNKKGKLAEALKFIVTSANEWTEQGNHYFDLVPQQAGDLSREELSVIGSHLCNEALVIQAESESGEKCLLDGLQALGLTPLFTEPTAECVRRKIIHLTTTCQDQHQKFISESKNEVKVWCIIATSKARDSLFENRTIDKKTLEIALLLISLSQQRQRLINEVILVASDQKNSRRTQMVEIESCLHQLVDECQNEALLWIPLQMSGRTLRVYVKTFYVIQAGLFVYLSRIPGQNCRTFKLLFLWTSVQGLVDKCSVSSLQVGWFPGLAKYFKNLREHFMRLQVQERLLLNNFFLDTQSVNHDILERELETACSIYVEIQALYESYKFGTALKRLVCLLCDFLNAEFEHCNVVYVPQCLSTTLDYISCLCGLLGQTRSREALQRLETLSERLKTAGISDWADAVCKTCTEIKRLTDQKKLPILHGSFVESIRMFEAGDCHFSRKALLGFWREISDCLREMPIGPNFRLISSIFQSMFLYVTQNLQQTYAVDLKYDTVEWFIKFRFQTAQRYEWPFLAGQIGAEYVDFLKERGQFSVAKEQCRLVIRLLVDKFGDDYQEWLPEAPNLTERARQLEHLKPHIKCG